MGQIWRLINLDKREAYGHWGKLGECLFDTSPNCLNTTLRAAPKLPDCDRLILPYKPGAPFETLLSGRTVTYFPQKAAQSSTLVNLPLEMIQEIYSNIEDFVDVVFLSVTCQSLWNRGREEIYRHVRLIAASLSWAGGRIICVGDYLENDDIPDHLLSPEEKAEFTRLDDNKDEDEDGESQHYTLYNYPWAESAGDRAIFGVRRLLRAICFQDHWVGVFTRLFGPSSTPNSNTHRPSPHRPCSETFRATSTSGNRRSSAGERAAQAEIKETRDVGFGHIVLSRICFSTSGSVAMVYDGDIHRGVWAGDRLDIVAESEFSDDDRSAWMDVSDEVLKEVEAIWRSEYLQ
ncbi:hypothetical protein B0H14DRAFT_3871600 [Mycena olivaceomarginata]|nr:hypothetical protein B0H14DRAFT_3871600 [Mycena olivaceomarginata]